MCLDPNILQKKHSPAIFFSNSDYHSSIIGNIWLDFVSCRFLVKMGGVCLYNIFKVEIRYVYAQYHSFSYIHSSVGDV